MKVNELMIGDWVRGFVPDSNSTIYGIFNEQRIAIIAEPSKAYIELSIDEIQPILLTPEILEKNGFVKTDDGWECDENHLVTIALHSEKSCDMWIAETSYEWKHLRYMLPSPKCVHELQHALLLVRIEKEIVL